MPYNARMDTFLTPGDAERLYGIPRKTVQNWIKSGHLPAINTAHVAVFKVEDFEAALKNRPKRGNPDIAHLRAHTLGPTAPAPKSTRAGRKAKAGNR